MRKTKINLKVAMLAWVLALGFLCPQMISATKQSVMCAKTNTGNYYPLVRISMLVTADKKKTFEIVLKDGEGEAGVTSISFEKHSEDIDFSKYKVTTEDDAIDMTKKIYLLTSTGKYFSLSDQPSIAPVAGKKYMTVTVGSKTYKTVYSVYFYRGDDPAAAATAVGIEAPTVSEPTEKLQLMTPVSSEIEISGCGNAKRAVLYSANGQKVGEAAVVDGMTTLEVGQLAPGMYIVNVGNKSLKFMKR